MRIAITGTPGVGKTSVAKLLARHLKYKHLNLNMYIKKEKFYFSYDKKRKCFVVDVKILNKKFVPYLKKHDNIIIDSHLSHFLKLIDIVFVLRCEPRTLAARMKKKGWSKEKVEENTEAELIGIIASEARQKHKKVYDIDTTHKNMRKITDTTVNIIKGRKGNNKPIDWIDKYR